MNESHACFRCYWVAMFSVTCSLRRKKDFSIEFVLERIKVEGTVENLAYSTLYENQIAVVGRN